MSSRAVAYMLNESDYTAHAALIATTEAISSLDVSEALQNPYAVNTMLPPVSSNAKAILTRSVSTAQVIGIPEIAVKSEENLAGASAASPATV